MEIIKVVEVAGAEVVLVHDTSKNTSTISGKLGGYLFREDYVGKISDFNREFVEQAIERMNIALGHDIKDRQ